MSQNDYTYLTPGATDTQQKLLYLIARGIDAISGSSGGGTGTLNVNDVSGQNGTVTTSNTSPVTGNFSAVQVLVAATFSAFTETGGTGAMTGFSIPAGVILYGRITGYTLSAGTVRAYNA